MKETILYSLGMVYAPSIESEELFEPRDKRLKKLLDMLREYSKNQNPFV